MLAEPLTEQSKMSSDAAPSDEELLRSFVERSDRDAMGMLFSRHMSAAYGLARRWLNDPADAEDAVQMAFADVLRTSKNFVKGGNVKAWLLGYVVNFSRHLAREKRTRSTHESRVPTRQPESKSAQLERHQTVLKVMDLLAEDYRIPLWLHYFEGLSTNEVAVAMGLEPATARKRLSRSIEQLRERLSASGVVLSAAALPALISSLPAEVVPLTLQGSVQTLVATLPLPAATHVISHGARMGVTAKGAVIMKISAGVLALTVVTSSVLLVHRNGAEEGNGNPKDNKVAPGAADNTPLGSPDFKPSPERPIGWRGDGSGVYPGATPPTKWSSLGKCFRRDLRCSAKKPKAESDGQAIPDGLVKEWLVLGPFAAEPENLDQEFVPKESDLVPISVTRTVRRCGPRRPAAAVSIS